jgi:hypothetical protein
MTDIDGLPIGFQTFEEVINNKAIYVDKTAFLAKMISTTTKTWFLARPRRFGKSLTVSTLETLLSSQTKDRETLFKGLAIESRLVEERFAPRPVIHLDFSNIDTSEGIRGFKLSLNEQTIYMANSLGFKLDPSHSAGSNFHTLINKAYETSGQ